MQDTLRLSIVIPCYNEAENIAPLLNRFVEVLADQKAVELILVDNGSRDGTAGLIQSEIEKRGLQFVKVVVLEKNQGYGGGILAGLHQARGALLAWTHADLQADPADLLRAWRLFEEETAQDPDRRIVVKGQRINRRGSEKIMTVAMQVLASLLLKVRLSDINAQPKLFPRKLWIELQDPPTDFSLDLYLLYQARKKGYKILTFPVDFKQRIHGEAKGGSGSSLATRLRLIRRTLCYLFELWKRETGHAHHPAPHQHR